MKRKNEDKSEVQVRKKHSGNKKIKLRLRNINTNSDNGESSIIPHGFKYSKSETPPKLLHKNHKSKGKKEPQFGHNTDISKNRISANRSPSHVVGSNSKSKNQPRKSFFLQKNKFQKHKKITVGNKPDWIKIKAQIKDLRHTRRVEKAGHEHYEMTVKCKQLWEKVRQRKCSKEERSKLVEELFVLLKGQVHMVVHNHDMARVVQWLLKLGCEEIRMSLCEELCAHLLSLLESKYAVYCVKRALKYAPTESRRHIIECIKGHVVKLLCHSIAFPVLEVMYSTWATAVERAEMRLELYGDLCSKYIKPEHNTLGVLENVPNDLRNAVLAATKANLEKMIDKQHMKSTLLYTVMLDFLEHCNESDRKEILESLNPHLSELQNSKCGVNIATLILQTGTNKTKKSAVKSIKGRVKEIATSEHGHLFLMSLFSHVDDTVLISKALFPELLADTVDIARNEYGRKVLLYIVAPKDPMFFHPKYIGNVDKCIASGTSKKDAAVKEKELRNYISAPLLEKIANDPATWIGDTNLSMLSLAILKYGSGDKLTKALNSVGNYASNEESKVNYNNRMYHAVEHSSLHMVFKKLIQHDKLNLENGLTTFSQAFVSYLNEDRLQNMIELNRGCFLLIMILEGDDKEAIKVLKSKFINEIKNLLQRQETTGARILSKKLIN